MPENLDYYDPRAWYDLREEVEKSTFEMIAAWCKQERKTFGRKTLEDAIQDSETWISEILLNRSALRLLPGSLSTLLYIRAYFKTSHGLIEIDQTAKDRITAIATRTARLYAMQEYYDYQDRHR